MCNNIIVLYIFMILKIICIVVLPVIIFLLRKNKISKILLIIDIAFLLFFLVCNTFNINKCVYNSNIEGIKNTKNRNLIISYNEMHQKNSISTPIGIEAEKTYKTYTGKTLYYFNQNKPNIKNASYDCNDTKIYFNTFGSSLTAFSISVSTLYENAINPLQIFEYYKSKNEDICYEEITIENIYSAFNDLYDGINVSRINKTNVEQTIKTGGLVIVELSASENSKLTCDKNYIVIYNIGLDGKYMIADPVLPNNSYVCAYSSNAYGSVINNDNMNKSWSLDQIDKDAESYYAIRKE